MDPKGSTIRSRQGIDRFFDGNVMVNGAHVREFPSDTKARIGATDAAGQITFAGTYTATDRVMARLSSPIIPTTASEAAGHITAAYKILASDTAAITAAALAASFNADPRMRDLGWRAFANAGVLKFLIPGALGNLITLTAPIFAASVVLASGGTSLAGEILTILFRKNNLPGGEKTLRYVVTAAQTGASRTTALAALINADTDLIAAGITATASSANLTIACALDATNMIFEVVPNAYLGTGAAATGSTLTMTNTVTESGTVVGMTGGTGLIVEPTKSFPFLQNNAHLWFTAGKPEIVDTDLLAALVAAGVPIK